MKTIGVLMVIFVVMIGGMVLKGDSGWAGTIDVATAPGFPTYGVTVPADLSAAAANAETPWFVVIIP